MMLLIDGDHVLYSACAAVEREVRWDAENHVLFSNAEEAWACFERMIDQRMETLGGLEVTLCFSGPNVFRHTIYPGYKAGRSRKPLCYRALLDKAFAKYSCKREDTLEADDLMGILATQGHYDPCIIVSDDKDLKTIPGQLYRLGELATISPEDADMKWAMQTLTGDVTDGYPGLPKMGEVTAAKFLGGVWKGSFESVWPDIVQLYAAKGFDEEYALTMARLARILRHGDYDYKTKEVKLWTMS